MKTLDLSTKSNIELELLLVREEKTIKAISNILTKIDEVCMEETGMTLEQLYEATDWAVDRINALKSEMQSRVNQL